MNTAVFPVMPGNLALYNALCRMRPEMNISTAVIPYAYRNRCKTEKWITVCHLLSELPEAVDTVLLLSFWDPDRLISEIRKMISSGKAVICYARVPEETQKELLSQASAGGTCLTFPDTHQTVKRIYRTDDVYTSPESIAVAVGSLTQGLDTTSSVISLYQKLTTLGYRVSVLATNPDLQALGFEKLPVDELMSGNPDQTIMMLNRCMNHHQFRYQADLVLIQLPDEGLHRTSLKYEVGFGARTYLIGQAMSIDYGVMLSPMMEADARIYQALSKVAEKRYGFQYDCIRILPRTVDEYDPLGAEKVLYCGVPEEDAGEMATALRKSAEDEGIDILFTGDPQNWADQTVQNMVDKLSG